MTPETIYALLAERMPHHAGVSTSPDVLPVPASAITDSRWLREQLDLSAKFYSSTEPEVLGTLWWYSASSILVAPSLESFVLTGTALDPSLTALTLDILPDGRILSARSSHVLDGGIEEIGTALVKALTPVMRTVASASGASELALGAILTDSLANRALWASTAAGNPQRALELAPTLVSAMDIELPLPRYQEIAGNFLVRRASCCLVYQTPIAVKCASCPRQTPEARLQRIRETLR